MPTATIIPFNRNLSKAMVEKDQIVIGEPNVELVDSVIKVLIVYQDAKSLNLTNDVLRIASSDSFANMCKHVQRFILELQLLIDHYPNYPLNSINHVLRLAETDNREQVTEILYNIYSTMIIIIDEYKKCEEGK